MDRNSWNTPVKEGGEMLAGFVATVKQLLAAVAGAAADGGNSMFDIGTVALPGNGSGGTVMLMTVIAATRGGSYGRPVFLAAGGSFSDRVCRRSFREAVAPGDGLEVFGGALLLPAAAGPGRAPFRGATADGAVSGALAGYRMGNPGGVHGKGRKGGQDDQQVEQRHAERYDCALRRSHALLPGKREFVDVPCSKRNWDVNRQG